MLTNPLRLEGLSAVSDMLGCIVNYMLDAYSPLRINSNMFDGFTISESTVLGLAVFSMVSFIGTLVLIPVLVVRIPEDYFAEKKRHRWEP